uniref:Uncharacterized protein n=1 Tax=Equus caballus TaxID=9796 RepID=A0A9L0SE80_HORSE
MVQMETQLQSIFEEVVVSGCFFSMFMDTSEDEKTKLISCLGAFRQFWGGLSQVSTVFSIHSADDF